MVAVVGTGRTNSWPSTSLNARTFIHVSVVRLPMYYTNRCIIQSIVQSHSKSSLLLLNI